MASYEDELDRARVPTNVEIYNDTPSPPVPAHASARKLSTSHNDGLPSPLVRSLYDKAGSALDKRSEDLLTSDGGKCGLGN